MKLSDDLTPIHYTSPDHHDNWHSCKDGHRNSDHIIHLAHARSFNLSCSEAMFAHVRVAQLILVYSFCNESISVHARLAESTICEHRYV
jgi:hypothetical protein